MSTNDDNDESYFKSYNIDVAEWTEDSAVYTIYVNLHLLERGGLPEWEDQAVLAPSTLGWPRGCARKVPPLSEWRSQSAGPEKEALWQRALKTRQRAIEKEKNGMKQFTTGGLSCRGIVPPKPAMDDFLG